MFLGMAEGSDVLPQYSAPPVVDELVEFFDFSSFGTLEEDDAGSKAVTPVKPEDFTDHLRFPIRGVEGGGWWRVRIFSIQAVEMGQPDAVSGSAMVYL
jgi:hypothetical protein